MTAKTLELLYALMGTTATFIATALGAALVFFFRGEIKPTMQRIFLGFAAGIMIAASVWSLLIPSIEMTQQAGQSIIPVVGGGFAAGGAFLLVLDRILPHVHINRNEREGMKGDFNRTTLIVFAVTLHNIPEGMAVGLSFALAAGSNDPGAFAAAVALAIGMGLQNFPEGAAISLPLKKEGMSNKNSFLLGALSGIVEPIAGVLAVLIASTITNIMPFILSFAAGAMIYVVVEELIPEANLGEHSHAGTVSVMLGFLIMMVLDIMI